jgi:nucleoid DNA-binding protein
MRKMQNEAMKQIHARLEASKDIDITGFGEFCKMATGLKHEDNPLTRIAIRMMCWSKATFERWVEEVPNAILVPTAKALMNAKGKQPRIVFHTRHAGSLMNKCSM